MNSVKNKRTCAETVAGLLSSDSESRKTRADHVPSVLVGDIRIPAQFDREAGTVSVSHQCLEKWAEAGWRGNPLIALLDFGDNGPRRIVEIHNKADGNCLLYALAFYLCVTMPNWHETVMEFRQSLLREVKKRLKEPGADMERLQAQLDDSSRSGEAPWLDDVADRYVFFRQKNRVDLGDVEIAAFTRLYGLTVCVWRVVQENGFDELRRISMMPDDGSDSIRLKPGDAIPDFGTCVHVRFYRTKSGGGHYTLLALLDSGATGFGRRYV
jgi:hypothetical protein